MWSSHLEDAQALAHCNDGIKYSRSRKRHDYERTLLSPGPVLIDLVWKRPNGTSIAFTFSRLRRLAALNHLGSYDLSI